MCALRVALVAAEPSGDVLGERLIAALRSHYPHWQFEGVGGPGMLAHGLRSLAPMETLSVMGLFEVLRHLPELLRLRRDLIKHWLAQPPDLFIGIDAPDFNLPLARQLRRVFRQCFFCVHRSVLGALAGGLIVCLRSICCSVCSRSNQHFYNNMGSRPVMLDILWHRNCHYARIRLLLVRRWH